MRSCATAGPRSSGTTRESSRWGTASAEGSAPPRTSPWQRTVSEGGAEAGISACMFNFALMLLEGRGTQKDEAAAVRWFEKCAALGDADSMRSLGTCLEAGRGTTRNPPDAGKWYRLAALQGHAGAMFDLGAWCAQHGATSEHSYIGSHLPPAKPMMR